MLAVLNQNKDTKLDASIFFKKAEGKRFAICSIDDMHNIIYLAVYSTQEQCDEVFDDMIESEYNLKTLFKMPKDAPEKYSN